MGGARSVGGLCAAARVDPARRRTARPAGGHPGRNRSRGVRRDRLDGPYRRRAGGLGRVVRPLSRSATTISSPVFWSRRAPASNCRRRRRRVRLRRRTCGACTAGRSAMPAPCPSWRDGWTMPASAPPERRSDACRSSCPPGTPRLTVLLLPDCDGSELALPVAPLDHWLARRPVRLTGVPRRGCRARGLIAAGNAAAVRSVKSTAPYHRSISAAGRDHA